MHELPLPGRAGLAVGTVGAMVVLSSCSARLEPIVAEEPAAGGQGGSTTSFIGCPGIVLTAAPEIAGPAPAMCTGSGQILCESFDAPPPEEWSLWLDRSAHAEIQSCQVRAGSAALRLGADDAGAAQLRAELPVTVAAGSVFARVFAYLPATAEIPEYLILAELWDEQEGRDFKISVDLVPPDSLELTYGDPTVGVADPAAIFPRDRWACVELAAVLAAGTGSVAVLLDGVPVVETGADLDLAPANPIRYVSLGARPSSATTGFDLFLDGLIVGTEPIGCD